ncbi:hypothetical protein [Streptomyces sp. NPDC018031]|uniref:hypothetical protein n=1 Tax=Streptomyces sp. NPDC018031 TaxID=3365033 RepID=UPI0037995EE0
MKAGVHSSGTRPADRCPPGTEHGARPEGGAVRRCDLVTVPARQGLEAVDILRLRVGVGPVLHDGSRDTLGFLVPPGTADRWDLPGSACTATHGLHACPEDPYAVAPPVTGTGWLVPPDAAVAAATDPEVLRQALGEAARTIEAVDRCR